MLIGYGRSKIKKFPLPAALWCGEDHPWMGASSGFLKNPMVVALRTEDRNIYLFSIVRRFANDRVRSAFASFARVKKRTLAKADEREG